MSLKIPKECICCCNNTGTIDIPVYSDSVGESASYGNGVSTKYKYYANIEFRICESCKEQFEEEKKKAAVVREIILIFFSLILGAGFYYVMKEDPYSVIYGPGLSIGAYGFLREKMSMNKIKFTKKYLGYMKKEKSKGEISLIAIFKNKEYQKKFDDLNKETNEVKSDNDSAPGDQQNVLTAAMTPEEQIVSLRNLLNDAKLWLSNKNYYPDEKEYPQFKSVQDTGRIFYRMSGFSGLEYLIEQIKSDGSDLYTYLDLLWNNLTNDEDEVIWIKNELI